MNQTGHCLESFTKNCIHSREFCIFDSIFSLFFDSQFIIKYIEHKKRRGSCKTCKFCEFYASSTNSEDITFICSLSLESYINALKNENFCKFADFSVYFRPCKNSFSLQKLTNFHYSYRRKLKIFQQNLIIKHK